MMTDLTSARVRSYLVLSSYRHKVFYDRAHGAGRRRIFIRQGDDGGQFVSTIIYPDALGVRINFTVLGNSGHTFTNGSILRCHPHSSRDDISKTDSVSSR
nr:hypothetical protein CFP56_34843 [Quercus suber]